MKFLIVDDHALIREAMVRIFKDLHPDCTVLEASSYATASPILEGHNDIDLILLDLNLPDRNGMDILRELRTRLPATAVAMLSGISDRMTVLQTMSAGAVGFIPKAQSRDVLVQALQLIFAGGKYIPEEVLTDASLPHEPSRYPPPPVDRMVPDASVRRTPAQLGLTERQIEVLALMMEGKSNKLICRALNLAEPTVKNHVSAVLKALGVSNRTEAVLAGGTLDWRAVTHPLAGD